QPRGGIFRPPGGSMSYGLHSPSPTAKSGDYMLHVENLESRRLFASVFVQTNLVSDGFVPAAHTDADLKNPWGVSFLPSGPFWISDNGTSNTRVYDSSGNLMLTVNITGGGGGVSAPTGQVANNTAAFVVSKGG